MNILDLELNWWNNNKKHVKVVITSKLQILYNKRIKITKLLSYVVCTQVRRHVHKQITKKSYGVEKSGRFIFGKPILYTLGVGLTTLYSLGILVSKFLPDSGHCV